MTLYPDDDKDPITRYLQGFLKLKPEEKIQSKVYKHMIVCERCQAYLKFIERHVNHASAPVSSS